LFEKSAAWRSIVKATRVRTVSCVRVISPSSFPAVADGHTVATRHDAGRREPQDSPSKFLGFGIVVGVVIPYLATDALISVRLSAPPPAP